VIAPFNLEATRCGQKKGIADIIEVGLLKEPCFASEINTVSSLHSIVSVATNGKS
jgi:hypothetical protein